MFADCGSVDLDRWMRRLAVMARRICGIEIDGRHAGSGFLAGPDVVVTCAHVIAPLLRRSEPTAWRSEAAVGARDASGSGIRVRFDASVQGAEERRVAGVTVDLAADWLVALAPAARDERQPEEGELDIALLRLVHAVGNTAHGDAAARGWIELRRAREPAIGEMAIMLQRSRPRALRLAPAYMRQLSGLRVLYEASTEGGASGSPLFDLRWNLVAMHVADDAHAAFEPLLKRGVPALELARFVGR